MFTSIRPKKSYEDFPDYINEYGQEVRVNRNRPNEKQIGRFTIIDEITPTKNYNDQQFTDVIIPKKNEQFSGVIGTVTKHIKLYPNKKIGRFTIKSITKQKAKSPIRKRKSAIKIISVKIISPKRKSVSPKKIGRFTITKKSYLK